MKSDDVFARNTVDGSAQDQSNDRSIPGIITFPAVPAPSRLTPKAMPKLLPAAGQSSARRDAAHPARSGFFSWLRRLIGF